MNIIFFTQEDPFYVKVFFEEFIRNYKPLDDIKAIIISKPMGKKSAFKLARQMYEFYGFYDFIRVGIRYAYIKIMGRKLLKKSNSIDIPKTYTLKQLAMVHGLVVIERSDLNSVEFVDYIRQYNADLYISVASPIIFKDHLINVPKLDCINIHSAPLPKYRGMLPNFWQLYFGEKKAGITIHRINSGIDAGDIISQHFVCIDDNESLNDLIIKTKMKGAHLIMDVIEDFKQAKVNYKKMEGKGSYFTFPVHKDVIEFKKRGRRLL